MRALPQRRALTWRKPSRESIQPHPCFRAFGRHHPDAIRSYVDSGAVSARPYLLNAAQRAKVDDALRNLPALHREKLHAHLRHPSFIDVPAGAGNGLTAVVNDGSFPVFDLTLRAGILNESLSEFLTSKERAIFVDDGCEATGPSTPLEVLWTISFFTRQRISSTMPCPLPGNWIRNSPLLSGWTARLFTPPGPNRRLCRTSFAADPRSRFHRHRAFTRPWPTVPSSRYTRRPQPRRTLRNSLPGERGQNATRSNRSP